MRVAEPAEPRGHRHPVDALFRSLAEEHGKRAVGIVLSGTGSDGSSGLREIQGHRGLALAQTPASAKFDGLPRSAIDAGVVDHVLAPEAMPELVLRYADHSYLGDATDARVSQETALEDESIEAVIGLLRARGRHDFRGYRRPTWLRRLHRRMGLTQTEDVQGYLAMLRQRPDGIEALARDLLIHVTSFFRDPESWDALEKRVVEPLVTGHRSGTPVRAWVAGCATGEEAYSLAMLLTEHLSDAGDATDLRVFATDVSEAVLARARERFYTETLLSGLSPERRRRFFTAAGNGFRVRESLHDTVVFAPHDLLGDPPFSRVDLISCRNVLIYLETAVQRRLLAILHLALAHGGHLFLGSAAGVRVRDELFEPVSKKHRIFRRVGATRHDLVSFSASTRPARGFAAEPPAPRHAAWARVAGEALAERYAPASVLVDHHHRVVYFHGETDRYLAQPTGEPTRDVVALARRGLGAPLRRALARAATDGEARVERARLWDRSDAGPVTIQAATIEPRGSEGHSERLFLVSFEESAATGGPADADESAAQDLARPDTELEREPEAVREELARTIQDEEAGQEELTAANEELTSINEELQSTNEELETSKEELQSLNEELRAPMPKRSSRRCANRWWCSPQISRCALPTEPSTARSVSIPRQSSAARSSSSAMASGTCPVCASSSAR